MRRDFPTMRKPRGALATPDEIREWNATVRWFHQERSRLLREQESSDRARVLGCPYALGWDWYRVPLGGVVDLERQRIINLTVPMIGTSGVHGA